MKENPSHLSYMPTRQNSRHSAIKRHILSLRDAQIYLLKYAMAKGLVVVDWLVGFQSYVTIQFRMNFDASS
jgi:hypothetical protein